MIEKKVKKILIYLDLLGFEKLAIEIEDTLRIQARKVRKDFLGTIKGRINGLKEHYPDIGICYGESDDWLLVIDNIEDGLRCVTFILDHNTDYLDYPTIPMKICLGTGDYDKWAKLYDSSLKTEDSTIQFLKSNLIYKYKQHFKAINKYSIRDTFVILTKEAYNKLEKNREELCNEILLDNITIYEIKKELLDKNYKIKQQGEIYTIHKEEGRTWYIKELKDSSTGLTKRYVARIIMDRHFNKDFIKTLIPDMINKVKSRDYYQNEMSRRKWQGKPADVVWLFIASDTEDITLANWICRVVWINPDLPDNIKPLPLSKKSEIREEIEIAWNEDYNTKREMYPQLFGKKEEILDEIDSIYPQMLDLTKEAIYSFKDYKNGMKTEDAMKNEIGIMEPEATRLYLRSGKIPFTPDDIYDYVDSILTFFAEAHNFFIFPSERSNRTRENRDWLMDYGIKRIEDSIKQIEFEKKKMS